MKSLKSQACLIGCLLVSVSLCAWGVDCAPFGQTQTGTITSPGQSNSCTFSANSGDVLDFTVVATSGSLSPEIQLYNSMGKLIAQASNRNIYGNCIGGAVIELNTVRLTAVDTYTAVVSDCSNTDTGAYNIYLQRTNNPTGATLLPFAQTQTGAIVSAAQSNSYVYTANASDYLDFTVVATGSLSPEILVYNPDGTFLTSASHRDIYGNCIGGSVLEKNTVPAPSAGRYTVLLRDCSDTNSGSYMIYSQRTNNPANAVTISFGQTQSGGISSVAQSNSYTFGANANDVVDFTVVATSGGLSPEILLYNPNGTLLSSASHRDIYGNCIGGTTVEMNTVSLLASGAYTVLLRDCSDTNIGTYDIYSQRTENPSGAYVLPFGQTQTGNITSPAQSNSYVFSANANDLADFTVVATSGSLSPEILLYNSLGRLVASASNRDIYGNCIGGSTIEMNTVSLASSDAYTVLIRDCSDINTGSFTVYAQRTNNPATPSMLSPGQTQSGNVASVAQSNSYVFSAAANDEFDFTAVATSGALSPEILVYNPNGTLLASASNRNIYGNCIGGATIEKNTVAIPTSGTYTVLLRDCSDTKTGTYNIYAQRTNVPYGPVPFVWGGSPQSGSIVSIAQSNAYSFNGAANTAVNLTMVTTSGSLSPEIFLYKPDGTLLASASNRNIYGSCIGGSAVNLNSITLPSTGSYAILVRDCSDVNVGNYNISGLCFGGCPQMMPPITWPTPASINYGTSLGPVQLDASSTVPGTFVYTPPSGTVLPIGPQTLCVLFTPNDTVNYTAATDCVQIMVNNTASASVNVATVTFPNQALATTSTAHSVILANIGPVPLSINDVAVNGYFAISSNGCGATLAVGKKCTVKVTFTPLQLGAATGLLLFSDSATNSPQFVVLKGTGLAQATLAPTSGTWGSVKVGTTSTPKTFTLTNNLPVALTGIAPSTTGDFAFSATTCVATLAAKGKCTVTVTFTPTAKGTRTGQLLVSDSASNSPQTSSLTGTGK